MIYDKAKTHNTNLLLSLSSLA